MTDTIGLAVNDLFVTECLWSAQPLYGVNNQLRNHAGIPGLEIIVQSRIPGLLKRIHIPQDWHP